MKAWCRCVAGLWLGVMPGAWAVLAPAASAVPGTSVVMVVNGEALRAAAVERQMELLKARASLAGVKEGWTTECFRLRAVENLVDEMLLRQAAAERRIEITRAELMEARSALAGNSPDAAALVRLMESAGWTEEDLNWQLRAAARVRKLILQEVGKIKIGERQVDEVLALNPQLAEVPERVSFYHVLIRCLPEADEGERAAASQKIETARQALATAVNPEEVCVAWSEDAASSGQKGRYEDVRRGNLATNFGQVVFSLTEGQTSEVIQSSHGYHVFRLESRKPAEKLPGEQVRSKARTLLETGLRQQAARSLLVRLRAGARIEYPSELNLLPKERGQVPPCG